MAESVLQITPSVLSPCSSGRRQGSDSMSPEFEFWMGSNPTLPQPKLLSAAELFSDGALLPLHRLQFHRSPTDNPTDPNQEKSCAQETTTGSDHNAEDSSGLAGTISAASKSWKDIFKKSDSCKKREKGNKKEMKNDTAGASNSSCHRISSAELNINIWPFSRSSSAGNGGSRPRMVTVGAGTRKVSSAPCSRSNSTGDFKSWKWSASPTQGGVHVSRNSPVWQVWRGGIGGSGGRATTDLVVENAQKVVQRENNEVAGNSLPPA